MASFEKKLENLINCYSKENDSDTPDYILAQYISRCLDTFAIITRKRDEWYNFKPWPEDKIGIIEKTYEGEK